MLMGLHSASPDGLEADDHGRADVHTHRLADTEAER